MWPAIVIGGGLSYVFSRVLAGDAPRAPYAPGAQRVGAVPHAPPPTRVDAHIDPQTHAGLQRLLMGGSPEQLDQAAFSLLRTGYPLAAEVCAKKAIAMRQFDEQRRASAAHRERMHAAQQVQAQALAAQNAQAQAVADAAAKMHQLAAEKGPQVAAPLPVTPHVQAAAVPGTVGEALPPLPFPVAPPTVPGAEAAPIPAKAKKARKARAPKLVDAGVAAAGMNGRATPEH